MACLGCPSLCATKPAPSPSRAPSAVARPQPSSACAPPSSGVTLCLGHAQKCWFSLGIRRLAPAQPRPVVLATAKLEPLKIMISGAPASGKGTQCELIKEKYGLVHIAAGDLLRAEVAAGTENGNRAKDYMENGMLVPDEIVVTVCQRRALESDGERVFIATRCQRKWLALGWLPKEFLSGSSFGKPWHPS